MQQYIIPAGIWRVKVQVGENSVAICNSADVTNRDLQTDVCKEIKALEGLPQCIRKRSSVSLRNEWRAHNLLYSLPLLPSGWRERLRVVDLDAEPLWRRAVYSILAIF